MTALAGTSVYLFSGLLNITLMAPMATGATLGAVAGGRVLNRLGGGRFASSSLQLSPCSSSRCCIRESSLGRKEYPGSGEVKLETGASYVLITGVLVSLVLEVAGMIMFYRAFHSFAIDRGSAMAVRGSNFFTFLGSLLLERSGRAPAVRLMMLGIAVLILTPYVRAVLSVAYFLHTKNVKYVIITLFVLVILTISLIRTSHRDKRFENYLFMGPHDTRTPNASAHRQPFERS